MEKSRRTMNSLSLADRLAVLAAYEDDPNVRSLARQFRCGRTQIRNILARRYDLLKEWQMNSDPNRLPKRRPGSARLLNVFLNEWVQRRLAYHDPLTNDAIRRKGEDFANYLRIEKFRPNKRWWDRFRAKYKITEELLLTRTTQSFVQKSLEIEDIIRDVSTSTDLSSLYPEYKKSTSFSLDTHGIFDVSNSSSDYTQSFNADDTDDTKSNGSVQESRLKARLISGSSGDLPQPQIEIATYQDALKHLAALEDFALARENIRLIGLLNQVENVFKDEVAKL